MKKNLIIVLVVLAAIILFLIPIISVLGHADIHPNNLFIAAKIMNGECGNDICEIDEISKTTEMVCSTSKPPVYDVACGSVTTEKILCEQDCKKPELTTKPETDY